MDPRLNEDPEFVNEDATEIVKAIIGAPPCTPLHPPQVLHCAPCLPTEPLTTTPPTTHRCAAEHGGACTDDIAACHYCVLQHRKQPE